MPTYDYRCNACGVRFELFQSMSEAHKKKCPECGKNKLERLIGAGAGFIFKGAGFYETDYRSTSYEEGAKADASKRESSASSNEAPKDASTSDSKAESKAESKGAQKTDADARKSSVPSVSQKGADPTRTSRSKPAGTPPAASKSGSKSQPSRGASKNSSAARRGRSKS